jgi:hypothetical protein
MIREMRDASDHAGQLHFVRVTEGRQHFEPAVRLSPYLKRCACAAIVAPSLTERDASAGDMLSSDHSSPMSPGIQKRAGHPR